MGTPLKSRLPATLFSTCRNDAASSARRSSAKVMAFQVLPSGQYIDALSDRCTQYFNCIQNSDLEGLRQILSPSVVYSNRVWSERDIVGLDKVIKMHQAYLSAYPNHKIHLDTVLARDDSNVVAVHWTARANNLSPYHGNQATGKTSVYSGVDLFVFDLDMLVGQVLSYRQPTEEERAFYLGWEAY